MRDKNLCEKLKGKKKKVKHAQLKKKKMKISIKR